ncbi:hypothetical protein LIER_18520 [Lithospermum erythrorhizon]|uniref:Uncharacterized protein n=1 Tax=Lithospermum erythrorhizon TaxID=34254 RepID=A0AAV3QHF7_LITER
MADKTTPTITVVNAVLSQGGAAGGSGDWWGDRPRGSERGAGSKLAGQGRIGSQAIRVVGGQGRGMALAVCAPRLCFMNKNFHLLLRCLVPMFQLCFRTLTCSFEDEEEPSGVPGLGGAVKPCEGASQPVPSSPGVQAAPRPLDEVDLLPREESSTLVGSDRSTAPPLGSRVDGD